MGARGEGPTGGHTATGRVCCRSALHARRGWAGQSAGTPIFARAAKLWCPSKPLLRWLAPSPCPLTLGTPPHSPEMVVGWYHSHPGFGCWLSGVDINTQQVCCRAGACRNRSSRKSPRSVQRKLAGRDTRQPHASMARTHSAACTPSSPALLTSLSRGSNLLPTALFPHRALSSNRRSLSRR